MKIMTNKQAWLIRGLFLFVILLAGCAPFAQPFAQHREKLAICINPKQEPSKECEPHALQAFPSEGGSQYLLGFVEFDDQGQLWDRKQMWAILDTLWTEAADKDLLIAVFVHGWKHSAKPHDTNIDTFREVLSGLSKSELHISQKDKRPARKVVGIYLGWRGGSIRVPMAEELTFWDRKNTAQKVSRGGVTEVLSQLELLKRVRDQIVQEENDLELLKRVNENMLQEKTEPELLNRLKDRISQNRRIKSGTRLVIVGHSFGGAIVFSSLVQILESRIVRTLGPVGTQSDVEGFGNLIVLINPALEALQFAPLSDMSTERGTYFSSQLPVMAVLTSEADQATRLAFPVGRRISTLFEKSDRDIKRHNGVSGIKETIHEGEATVTAIGHFEPYRTHKLYPAADAPVKTFVHFSGSESVNSASAARSAWENDEPGSRIPIAGLTLERTDTSAGRNPYLVVKVHKSLIAGHNNIDHPRILEFLKQLILISTLP